jgi:hypothetical protein
MTESRSDIIVAYGDSQTEGFSWGHRLPLLSSTIKETVNRGLSGQEAGTVAVRQGGIVLSTTTAVEITSAEPVIVGLQADRTPCNIRSSSSTMPMELSGERGTLTILTQADTPEGMPVSSRSNGTFCGHFVPDTAPAGPVTVAAGTEFVSQDVVDHPEYAECTQIIWVGGNDSAFAGATRVTGVVSAVQAMVDRLKATVDQPRFLVAARTSGPSEVTGTAGHTTAVDQHAALAAAFPDNTIDIRGHMIAHGMQTLGLTPTADDQTAIDGDTVPRSLTSDGLHYSTQTREQVLAPFIISELAARGWATETEGEVIPVAEYSPNTWVNDSAPDLEADNLNNIEAGIQQALEEVKAATQGVADLRENKADATALTSGLAGKLTALPTTQKNKIYGTGINGEFATYNYVSSGADANSVAARSSSGNVAVALVPSADMHATSKKYVDDGLAKKADTTAIPDVSGLAAKADIPDVSGLAKTTDVPTKADFDALAARVAALETPAAPEA